MSNLSRSEQIEILERIAREGSDTARIQAIRTLRLIDEEGQGPEGDDDFEKLIRRKSTVHA